jgi:hypothetical protein
MIKAFEAWERKHFPDGLQKKINEITLKNMLGCFYNLNRKEKAK